MNTEKHPAPSPAVKKDNGKWTFHVYPDGRACEAGQYETEAAAKDARFKVLLGWGANGERYESRGSVTTHRFLD